MLKQSLEESIKTDTKDLDQGASAKTSAEEGRGGEPTYSKVRHKGHGHALPQSTRRVPTPVAR
eukprot:15985438-Heterocapsa_arctica.AAC.1